MSVIHQPRKPELDARVLLFPSALFLLLSVLFLRLWYFQVVRGEELAERASVLGETGVPELAPRGLMYDRNGVLLAGVKPEWVVTAVPRLVDTDSTTIPRLAKLLNADPVKLKAKVEDGRWQKWLPTPIYIGATTEVASNLAERVDEFPGIDVRSQPMRYYPDPNSFSQLMGYVWVPSKEDVIRMKARGKKPADYVGKGGLEWWHEEELMGSPGQTRMELDAKGRPTKVVGRDAPVPGDHLILSLDKNLQQEAVKALAAEGHPGTIVALDPKTGEILCAASYPTFDLNLFKQGINQADFNRLRDDPSNPFLNRAVQIKYAPGSTFKIVTTIAAMQRGLFDPNKTFYCGGGIRLGNRFIKCLGHHGTISFNRALAKSCNSYFMSLALQVDREGMLKAAEDVGFYKQSGVDIPYEKRGDLPTPRYMAQYYPKYHWPLADTAYLGIGQGILAVSPMQMVNLIALVANDGVNYRPHVIHAVKHPGENMKTEVVVPEVLHKVDGSAEFWHTLKGALVSVIEEGTATHAAKIPGFTWGGKTGSAEEKKGDETHSWFVGFAPYEQPKIAICVFMEKGGHGTKAAGLAKRIVQLYLASKEAKAPSRSLIAPDTSVDLVPTPNR